MHPSWGEPVVEAAPAASYDLIVSADTLCYFGELHAVARGAARALRAGGSLVFTVEALADEATGGSGYRLNPHGRYSHREAYVREVLVAAGFAPVELQHVHLRTEGGKPVEGWLVCARASTQPPEVAPTSTVPQGTEMQGA